MLIVTNHLGRSADEAWLLDDLARALVRQGHAVDVLVADPKRPRPRGLQPSDTPGLRIMSVGPEHAGASVPSRVRAHLAVVAGLWTRGRRWARAEGPYDLGLYTSIAAFSWGLPGHLRRRGTLRALTLVLWDFFPVHQLEIGRLGGATRRLGGLLKHVEARAVAPADVVALMSPANVDFFHRYFPRLRNRTVVVPPWSSAAPVPAGDEAGVPDRLRVVFGGQLARGRGVATLVEAARLLAGDPVEVVVAGDGPERETLERRAAGTSVRFLGQVPRPDYRRALASADVGLAITVEGVSPPTFPSKIAEYCAVGLPVLVAVEPSSDAGRMVEEHGAGLAVPAGDPAALAQALRRLRAEQEAGELAVRADAARRFAQDRLSVDAAARSLVSTAADPA